MWAKLFACEGGAGAAAAAPEEPEDSDMGDLAGEAEEEEGGRSSPPPARPDFTTVPSVLRAPARVHRGDRWDLRAGALWSVSTEGLPTGELVAHLSALTCAPKRGGGLPSADQKPFHIGHEAGGRLYMPPAYAAAAFPVATVQPGDTVTGEPMRPEAVFTGQLWQAYPPQAAAAARYAEWAATSRSPACILSLPCGHGKSVVCLHIAAAQVRRVTLILVHMCGLVGQWVAEAKKYVPGARVGYVTRDSVRVEGVDFIVASIHTLRSHMDRRAAAAADNPLPFPYLDRLRERVGFVIMDEAHHGVANTFQRVMAAMPAARRMAVTATPRRSDGLFDELQFIFGPVVFRSYRRRGDCQVVMLRWDNPALKERMGWGPGGTRLVRVDLMEDDVLADFARTDAVVQLTVHLVTTQQRRVLLVSPRKAYVQELAGALQEALAPHAAALARTTRVFVPAKKPPAPRRRKGESVEEADARKQAALWEWEDTGPHGEWQEQPVPLVGAVVEGMAWADRTLQYEAPAVVATTDIMKEGVSFNAWDTLVDLDSVNDPEQVVGRIQRAGDKKVPLVVDVWSAVSLWSGQKQRRVRFYTEEELTVHFTRADAATWRVDPEYWARFNRRATAVL